MDTNLVMNDHGPIFGKSDRTLFMSFIAYNIYITNYPSHSSCSIYESDFDGKITIDNFL